ncbi:MAG: tyrosine-type recombinase/integrase [Promicromonosporaceae bacterium]|nr:tyrosine-type recombinase/integrase [Promicromonosporaceae bacterium]
MGRSAATVRTYTQAVQRLEVWAVERELGPCDVGPAHLLAFLGHRADWSAGTLRVTRAGIAAFYRWAVLAGHLCVSPALNLPTMPTPAPAPHPTPRLAYESALRAGDGRERLMVRLALEVGLRRAEVAQVRPRRDVVGEPGDRWLIVHGKGAKERQVPLPDDLAAAMLVTAGSGWLFPGRTGGHLSPGTVGAIVSALLPEGTAMHALRHRFATDAYEAFGGDVFAVQQLLGHASSTTTERYVRVPSQRLRAAMQAGRALRSAS